ncbi:MAG: twin-arginine translocation signal domain-containing protein, partial [Victivallales bacterium]|nr:twin-arginine translocation signal domain-containing protein [Victivallales bacterium]
MNRRDFLKNSAVAAAGAAVLPNMVSGAEAWDVKATEKTHAPIRMGVIGIGIQCIGHIRHLMHRADARIMALCDVESIRLNRAKDIVNEAYKQRFGKEAR